MGVVLLQGMGLVHALPDGFDAPFEQIPDDVELILTKHGRSKGVTLENKSPQSSYLLTSPRNLVSPELNRIRFS